MPRCVQSWHGGQRPPELRGSKRGGRVQVGPARQPLSQPGLCRRHEIFLASGGMVLHQLSLTSVCSHTTMRNVEKSCFFHHWHAKHSREGWQLPDLKAFHFTFAAFSLQLKVPTDSHILFYQRSYFLSAAVQNISRYHPALPEHNLGISELAAFLRKNCVVLVVVSLTSCTESCKLRQDEYIMQTHMYHAEGKTAFRSSLARLVEVSLMSMMPWLAVRTTGKVIS